MPLNRKVRNAQDYFDTLHKRFVKSKAVDGVYKYVIGGKDWYAVIQDRELNVYKDPPTDQQLGQLCEEYRKNGPAVLLEANEDNWVKLVNGDMGESKAALTRALKVTNIMGARKMGMMFPTYGG